MLDSGVSRFLALQQEPSHIRTSGLTLRCHMLDSVVQLMNTQVHTCLLDISLMTGNDTFRPLVPYLYKWGTSSYVMELVREVSHILELMGNYWHRAEAPSIAAVTMSQCDMSQVCIY